MTKTYDQTTGELCEKCGWSMKFPDEPCRCELERENAALRAWKESALAVERELNAQTLAKLLGARLGESCHKAIAEKVPQLVAENIKLRAVLQEIANASDLDYANEWIRHSAQSVLGKEAQP